MSTDVSIFGVPPEFVAQDSYLIGGELRRWNGPLQTVVSYMSDSTEPMPPTVLGKYPLLSRAVAVEVLDSAVEAFDSGRGTWPTMHPLERIACVRNFVSLMKKQRQHVIHLLMWEIGKTYKDACSEFDRTVEYIQKTATFYERKVRRLRQFRTVAEITSQLQFSPRGVTLCMGPYNYPLNETFTVLIPALITGNVVIFKPPRMGVLLHQPLLTALAEAFPAGVVNTIYGEGQKVVSPLIQSGKIDVFAFIGSAKVSDLIRSQHPLPHRLHTVLGLEAKNCGIIFNDCDLTTTLKECVLGALSFNGQRCTALKTLFVERSIASEFVKAFSTQVDALKLGAPWEEGVSQTPLPETTKLDYLEALVTDAMGDGAKQTNQRGGRLTGTRFFPVVLYPVSLQSRVANEEQFGPVVPIIPFDDFAEVVDYVTKSPYGQQLSVFTTSEMTVVETVKALGNQVSRININSQCQRGPDELPFTGRKDSAQGILSIREALRAFSLPLVVAGKSNVPNNRLFKKTFTQEKSSLLKIWHKLRL